MANFKDMLNIATSKIAEWEGGGKHHNPERDTWTAYDDEIGGNVPTLGPGITGQIGGEDIEIGKEYPSDAVSGEFGGRLQDEYDWISSKMGKTWGGLNQSGNLEGFAYEAFDPEEGFVKAGGKIVPGLQNRRAKERDLFFTDMSESAF